MVTIANCFDIIEANRLRMALEAEGIPSFIPDEHVATTIPFHLVTSAGVRLQVPDEYADVAREIVNRERQA